MTAKVWSQHFLASDMDRVEMFSIFLRKQVVSNSANNYIGNNDFQSRLLKKISIILEAYLVNAGIYPAF